MLADASQSRCASPLVGPRWAAVESLIRFWIDGFGLRLQRQEGLFKGTVQLKIAIQSVRQRL